MNGRKTHAFRIYTNKNRQIFGAKNSKMTKNVKILKKVEGHDPHSST